MSFAENLKRYRKLRGIAQKDMAKDLNMATSSYGFYEQGRSKPDTDKLVIIASKLRVSTDKLLDFHIDEFEHCKTLWTNAGFTIKSGISINHSKVTGVIFIDHDKITESIFINHDEIKNITLILPNKEKFIELTKEFEGKCKALMDSQFTDLVKKYFEVMGQDKKINEKDIILNEKNIS